MKRRYLNTGALVMLLIVLWSGHLPTKARAAAPPETLRRIAADLVTGHAIPGYRTLATAAGMLHETAVGFCDAPDAAGLADLRASMLEAQGAWMSVQHIRFGAVMAENRLYRIQFWPDPHGRGGKHLRRLLAELAGKQGEGVSVAKRSVAVQGLPVLERLLFTDAADVLLAASTEGRIRCRLVAAVTENLRDMARAVLATWVGVESARAREWRAGLGESDAARERVQGYYRAFVDGLQLIADFKLARPLGEEVKKARPRLAESWRSESSMRNVADNLEALRDLFAGAPDDAAGLSLALAEDGEEGDYRRAIGEGLDFLLRYLAEHDIVLHRATLDEEQRAMVDFIVLQVRQIRDMAVEQLAPALGVSTGFNAFDGD